MLSRFTFRNMKNHGQIIPSLESCSFHCILPSKPDADIPWARMGKVNAPEVKCIVNLPVIATRHAKPSAQRFSEKPREPKAAKRQWIVEENCIGYIQFGASIARSTTPEDGACKHAYFWSSPKREPKNRNHSKVIEPPSGS